ncbi:Cytoplasmic copper homeostasis protein cutC [hydrothermal vent metagenome]|uniref:Cytoplasmic copper homeostasis protein cutC n=1 Tax=hydrothermal vent metagenome TaxID=652676 RepID=A0A3B0TPG2_9ZZZZ
MLVEVCANSLRSAINAEKEGADRIELCTELGAGGVLRLLTVC